jgi:hypothetical protein
MEARFPTSRRTYTKLKDIEVCGADINVTHVRMATEHLDTWEQLIGNRKSPFRQAAIIGLDTAFKYLMRQFTLHELVERVCERIGIRGRAIIWDRAEPCMDVDKPHQLELMRGDFARRLRKTAAPVKKPASRKKAVQAKPAGKKKTGKAKTGRK